MYLRRSLIYSERRYYSCGHENGAVLSAFIALHRSSRSMSETYVFFYPPKYTLLSSSEVCLYSRDKHGEHQRVYRYLNSVPDIAQNSNTVTFSWVNTQRSTSKYWLTPAIKHCQLSRMSLKHHSLMIDCLLSMSINHDGNNLDLAS